MAMEGSRNCSKERSCSSRICSKASPEGSITCSASSKSTKSGPKPPAPRTTMRGGRSSDLSPWFKVRRYPRPLGPYGPSDHKNSPWPAAMQARGLNCAGGGAENRTPVHGRKSRGVYRLSRCSSRKGTWHTDKRGGLPPVQSWLAAYRLRPRVQSPDNDPVRMPGI